MPHGGAPLDTFKTWLQDELGQLLEALNNIPPAARKGLAVAMQRKRSRDIETALQLWQEFELATPLPPFKASHITHGRAGPVFAGKCLI